MEKFIQAYLELCPENEDTVSRDKLIAHCETMGLDQEKVQQWLSVYDVDKDGQICFEEFCRGIGMDVEELRAERHNRFIAEDKHTIADDITIINSSMTINKAIEITEKFKLMIADIPDKEMNLGQVIEDFKAYLDETHKSSWQVVVVYGSYCMKFSHIPFQSLQFTHKKRAVLIWRTPSN